MIASYRRALPLDLVAPEVRDEVMDAPHQLLIKGRAAHDAAVRGRATPHSLAATLIQRLWILPRKPKDTGGSGWP